MLRAQPADRAGGYTVGMSDPRRPHVVIVGGGFGGLNAVRALRRAKADITLVDRRNHHLFQPLLYQVATGGLAPSQIAYPIRAIVRRQRNTRVLLDEVLSVDVAAQELILREGKISYDYLILAAGAEDSYFGHDDWERNAPGLKSLEDALEIRRRILLAFERAERETSAVRRAMLLTFVIIGAGPTGVELAGAIAEISRRVMVSDFRSIDPRQARIVLVEAGPRILPSFPASISASAKKSLVRIQVEVLTDRPVTSVGVDSVGFNDQRIQAGTILWAAGVKASPLMKTLGVPLDRAGRVIVAPDLSVPGHPEIFVIGDAAAVGHQTGKPVPGVAPAAIQQGRYAAHNVMRALEGQPREAFRYRNMGNLATIGRSMAVAEFGRIRLSGFVAWMLWLFVHILYLVSFRNRITVTFEWAWDYFTFQRGARLITGDIDRVGAGRMGQDADTRKE